MDWREDVLLPKVYGSLTSLSGRTLLGDDVVDKLATCSEQIEDYSQLRRHVYWAFGHDTATNDANKCGLLLIEELKKLHRQVEADAEQREEAIYRENTQQIQELLRPRDFDVEIVEHDPGGYAGGITFEVLDSETYKAMHLD